MNPEEKLECLLRIARFIDSQNPSELFTAEEKSQMMRALLSAQGRALNTQQAIAAIEATP
jgi:hypothetical protein